MNQPLFNPDLKFGQKQIAEILGISDRQVRNLQNSGVLPKAKGRDGIDPLASIHAYISYKSVEEPVNDEPETPADEQLKKREQELKNDEREERIKLSRVKRLVLEKQYAPITIITETISRVAVSLRTRVDSWLPKLKMACPDMSHDQIELLKRELAMALNELADVTPDLFDYEDSDIESGFAGLETIESDDPDDGSRMG
ncbi:MAG: hypothetical protein CENE_02652 [Candidatus Celerinatantimonas neptuna]|nr:MAG: hypothetical protein CENE_02652 [Candidatus Celerinatantimonas neptuna]